MFIDEVKVYAAAGHGGKGCVAFQREAYRPKGGPSGGNGGRGGNVILIADHDLNNLVNQFYSPRLIAEKGQQGLGKGMDGHAGADLVIKVPCGTLVWRLPQPVEAEPVPAGDTPRQAMIQVSGAQRPVFRYQGGARAVEVEWKEADAQRSSAAPQRENLELVADLTSNGQEFILCKGGRGGLGNRNFATSRHQTPRFAQPGEDGEAGEFILELRILADVGLVGYPNAGKSTLLGAISRARPKIAPYPFTTLRPQVGMVDFEDFRRLTVCDVPGLIEGAHRNVGLGHAFLRHLQRCTMLILLLDMAGTDGRTPWDDYRQVLRELELHDPALVKKPRLVVANKMDEPTAPANLKKFKRHVRKVTVLPISAAFDQGMDLLKQTMREMVDKK